jgi:hypothetical protein
MFKLVQCQLSSVSGVVYAGILIRLERMFDFAHPVGLVKLRLLTLILGVVSLGRGSSHLMR